MWPRRSIAIQGVCHTWSRWTERFDDVRATLGHDGLEAGREVNLEKSLRLADRLGGHLMQGHVDGVGTVTAFEDVGGSWRLEVEAPAALARYIAKKGSIAVDGVSLTVNSVEGSRFEVNIIPHTRAVTTFRNLASGMRVNVEVDMVARYLERLSLPGSGERA